MSAWVYAGAALLVFLGVYAAALAVQRAGRAGYLLGLDEAERIASHHNADAAFAISYARREFVKRAP